MLAGASRTLSAKILLAQTSGLFGSVSRLLFTTSPHSPFAMERVAPYSLIIVYQLLSVTPAKRPFLGDTYHLYYAIFESGAIVCHTVSSTTCYSVTTNSANSTQLLSQHFYPSSYLLSFKLATTTSHTLRIRPMTTISLYPAL